MKKHSHVLLPVLAPEPEKVNPLGLNGGEEENWFHKKKKKYPNGRHEQVKRLCTMKIMFHIVFMNFV